MQVLLSDKELNPPTPTRKSSSSSTSSGPSTPGFQPNIESPIIPATEVSIPALLHNVASASPVLSSRETLHDVDDISLDPALDLSKPISTLLKEGTMRAHTHAENSAGAAALISGKLPLEEYITWLAILWRVYDALELALAGHSPNPVLAPTYDPAVLGRSNPLAKDISHLLTLLPPSPPSGKSAKKATPSGPLPPFALPPFLEELWTETPAPLQAYLSHIQTLSSSSSSAPSLLAHAYVRYLGDLSGGQVIGARVRKAYGLKGNEGTAFYEFEIGESQNDDESKDKRKKRMTELKDWYRRGMDEGVGDDEELKAHLVKEANLAFALNTHLFTLIPAPSGSPTSDGAVAIREGGTSVAVQRPQRELRYYERRELEWREKERLRIEKEGPDNTWRQLVERFAFFAFAAILGWAIANYGEPVLGPKMRELWRRFGPLIQELSGKKRGAKRF